MRTHRAGQMDAAKRFTLVAAFLLPVSLSCRQDATESISKPVASPEPARSSTPATTKEEELELPFQPTAIRVSPDGNRVVVLCDASRNSISPKCSVAVVNVADLSVGDPRVFDEQVHSVAIDAHAVYIELNTEIRALDPSTLNRISSVQTAQNRAGVALGPKGTLLSPGQPCRVYQTRSLELIDVAKLLGQNHPWLAAILPPGSCSGPVRITDGWLLAGFVFDENLTEIRMMIAVRDLAELQLPGTRPRPPEVSLWGCRQSGTSVDCARSGRGDRISLGSLDGVALLTDYPAVARVRYIHRDSTTYGSDAILEFVDLVNAEPGRKHVVRSFDGTAPGIPGEPLRVAAAPGLIAASAGTTLRLVRPAQDEFRHCRPPFEFELVQPVRALDPNGPTTLRYSVRGGQAPVEFELTTPAEGMRLDSRTGTVTISSQKLMATATTQLAMRVPVYAEKRPLDTSWPEDYRRRARDCFLELVGHEPAGLPMIVSVGLAARDAGGQTASLLHQVLLDVPSEPVLLAIQNRWERIHGRESQQEREQLLTRLANLEDLIVGYEAQVNLLLEQLRMREERKQKP